MYKRQPQRNPDTGIPSDNPEIQRLVVACQQSGLTRLPEIASALEFLLENPHDKQLLELVQEAIAGYAGQQLVSPDPFRATNPIDPESVCGQIKLGFVEHSDIKYGVNPDELTTHLLICGRTGGGKTSTVLLILSQILELRKQCL